MPLFKQILREGVVTLTLMAIGLVTTMAIPTAAASAIKTPDQLCQLGGFACPKGDDGIQKTENLVGKLAYNLRLFMGAVAVLVIVISGIKLITAAGNEEVFRKESTALIFGVIGLATITLAGEISEILSVEGGGFFASNNQAVAKSRLFHRATEIVITFLKYIIGSVAVIFIVRNGMRLVLLGGNEEEVTKDKKNIFYGMFGLVLILIANPIVNKVFFKIDMSKYPGTEAVAPGIDMKRLLLEIAGMTNLVAALAGPFALLSLVAGGLMYVIAAGDDEKIGKAKKIITWSLIGLVVMYSAFGLVSLFVAREFQGI